MEHQFDSTNARRIFADFSYVKDKISSIVHDDSPYIDNLENAIRAFEYEIVSDILNDTVEWYSGGEQYIWVKGLMWKHSNKLLKMRLYECKRRAIVPIHPRSFRCLIKQFYINQVHTMRKSK